MDLVVRVPTLPVDPWTLATVVLAGAVVAVAARRLFAARAGRPHSNA